MPKIIIPKEEKGQVLVILAVSLMVLLIFIGLAIDGTELFLNYTRLKRSVDAAAVAAANDFKRGSTLTRMTDAATEILTLHQVDTSTVAIKVYMCDADGDGSRDFGLNAEVPEFFNMCPAPGQMQKKLIYIRAFENSPTYFVQLVGIRSVPISTTAVAEAAPIDLVIVMDTSESMGNTTSGYSAADFDPSSCNATNTCQPLKQAKDAAKFLVKTLYPGYDRVAIVTFDTVAITRYSFGGSDNGDVTGALSAIDSRVTLHDDPPANKLFASWYNAGTNGRFNPVNPEDRDNNGSDTDTGTTSTQCTITVSGGDRWDTTKDIPCDNASYLDAFDWNQDGLFTAGTDGSGNCTASPATGDHCISLKWEQDHNPLSFSPLPPMSLVSTCSGCGIREATANLLAGGRSNAVWVMVFLSDGLANMTDTPQTYPYNSSTLKGIPSIYPNGFCGGSIDVNGTGTGVNYWKTNCIKWDTSKRYCINADWTTCPTNDPRQTIIPLTKSGSGYTAPFTPPYSPEDYARDMTDAAALQKSTNPSEKMGNDIAIYSIGFGDIAALGEPLLRYMAAVGDDGDRMTDPCSSTPAKTSCGQYYFAQNTSDLMAVFQDIASRIYTKISE
jgi:hypothetical protein